MATRIKSASSTGSKIRIHYHSAIGTHRLKPRPLKNILYPYYRNYKPVYRARNPRTPLYYWPEIDKYPWHSHQKRYVNLEDITITLFSEFLRRNKSLITLYELLHTLPLNGVGCLCWKPEKYKRNTETNENKDSNGKIIFKIDEFDYVINTPSKNNQYFLIKNVKYTTRPFRAKVLADLYLGDKLIKKDVSPIGSVRGVWEYSFPYSLESNKSRSVDEDKILEDLESKVTNLRIYRPNNILKYKELIS
ncbi:uncharacterized protein TA14725 [Theileria annulata]|uniref:Uncharacterized protein n=1 Tax=Theileria annulata TaxID=5874 RepID=Q4UDE4_THEAN|nr:uncharacterized protein TA14725 [Theileria annulata]CAI74895.1 hypothetical protein, conserved [Theileria annulata]|eukprot:XP_952627.1 hypothetical protein, conserved [Theileria annulata]